MKKCLLLLIGLLGISSSVFSYNIVIVNNGKKSVTVQWAVTGWEQEITLKPGKKFFRDHRSLSCFEWIKSGYKGSDGNFVQVDYKPFSGLGCQNNRVVVGSKVLEDDYTIDVQNYDGDEGENLRKEQAS